MKKNNINKIHEKIVCAYMRNMGNYLIQKGIEFSIWDSNAELKGWRISVEEVTFIIDTKKIKNNLEYCYISTSHITNEKEWKESIGIWVSAYVCNIRILERDLRKNLTI